MMKTCEKDLEILYEEMGKICLCSSFMELEDQERIADLVEKIIEIFKSYGEK